jgi:single-strand DNA-binding protein
MSFNKIIIMGNLGRDPELRYTPQGDAVCNFSVAVGEKKRDKAGELQEITTWFKVTLWRKQAENASKYLTKGNPVVIEGRLQVDEWTDRDGNNRYTLEINATDMHFVGGGKSQENAETSQESSNIEYSGTNDSEKSPQSGQAGDDDIPF